MQNRQDKLSRCSTGSISVSIHTNDYNWQFVCLTTDGAILVFLPGWDAISEVCSALEKLNTPYLNRRALLSNVFNLLLNVKPPVILDHARTMGVMGRHELALAYYENAFAIRALRHERISVFNWHLSFFVENLFSCWFCCLVFVVYRNTKSIDIDWFPQQPQITLVTSCWLEGQIRRISHDQYTII